MKHIWLVSTALMHGGIPTGDCAFQHKKDAVKGLKEGGFFYDKVCDSWFSYADDTHAKLEKIEFNKAEV